MKLSTRWVALLAFVCPVIALADINSSTTIPTGSSLNLDTGTVVTSGGDLLYNGSTLTPQGNAIALAYIGGGSALFNLSTQATLQAAVLAFSATAIPYTSLSVGTVIAVKTNGGNYAKLLVSVSAPGPSGLLTDQYTTHGATWSGGAPGTYVVIEGQSTVSAGTGFVSATFTCYAPVSAGQFTVPSWILLALPPNNSGSMSLENQTFPQLFSASGLDYASGSGGVLVDKALVYQ